VNCNTNYKKGGGNYVLKHCSTVSWATYCATVENITQQTTNIKPSTTHAQHRNRSDNTSHVHNKAILSTNEVAHQIWSQPVNSHRCWITFPLTTGGSTWLFATFQIARLCPLIQVVGSAASLPAWHSGCIQYDVIVFKWFLSGSPCCGFKMCNRGVDV